MASYLGQAIGSAVGQTEPPHEILVVDDGSTDGSLTIARRFEARFPGLVSVRMRTSLNACLTRNLGASIATGDALLFLDGDDVLGPDAVATLTAALERQPDGIAVCPWYRLDLVDGRWVQRPPSCASRRPGEDALSAWLNGWYHPPCSVLWSRSAFEHVGRWDERCRSNQDGDLMMRALASGVPLIETSRGASYYRRAPEGVTSLASARFTAAGIVSRLRAIEKVAVTLEEQGQLDSFRGPIHAAYTAVARDLCAGHPELGKRALAEARRHTPPRVAVVRERWSSIRQKGQQTYQQRRRQLRTGLRQLVRRRPSPPTVITFGFHEAMEALATSTASTLPADIDRPTVSVIIPTYNRATLLRRAVDSALSQTMSELEVLVVDDGSSDDTAGVIGSYGDARLRYLRQASNMGVSAARNRGMREARGEFIAFLDSDDEWLPHKLELQVERLRQSPSDVGLLYGAVENHDEGGHRDTHVPSHRGDVFDDFLTVNVIHGTSSVVIRRSVVATVGFFDEGIPAIEDYDYWLRVARFFRVDFVEEPVSRYYDLRSQDRKSVNVQENLEARAWFYDKHGAAMRQADVAHHFLLRSVRRHLRTGDVRSARRLAVRAARHAPTRIEPYRRIFGTLVPWRLRWTSQKEGEAVLSRRSRQGTGGRT